MRIVVDTNVFMAAMLKDSIVRTIISSKEINFYIPEFALEELRKYEKELCEKSGLSKDEFNELIILLLNNINIIPKEDLEEHINKSEEIMRNIDIKDSHLLQRALL